MKMIRPVSDLRNNFSDISKTVHETARPRERSPLCFDFGEKSSKIII